MTGKEIEHENNWFTIETAFSHKRVSISMVVLVIAIIGYEIFSVFYTQYEAAAGLTPLFGIIRVFVAWVKAIIYAVMMIFLLLFIFKRETHLLKSINVTLFLKMMVDFLIVLITMFMNPTLGLFIILGIIVYHLILISYIKGVIRQSKNNQQLPNPIYAISAVVTVIGLLIFN